MLHPLRETDPHGPAWPPAHERPPPPMDHRIGGRKASQYSDRLARIILARIEAGETVAALLAEPDMPSKRTLYDWIARHRAFGAAWDQMRRDLAAGRRDRVARLEQGVRRAADIHARAEGRKPRAKAGRRSTFTPERGQAVCALVAKGRTTRAAGREAGLANAAILYRWLRNHPEFRGAYVAACRERHQGLEIRRLMLVDRIDPDTIDRGAFRRFEARLARIEGKMGALMPDVWRWD